MTEAEFVRFACPCGSKLKIATVAAGKTVTCPKCKRELTVPAAAPPSRPLPRRPAPISKPVWYYYQQGQECGPVTWEHLRTLAADGVLLPNDQIWKEGMPEWVEAETVRGLFSEAHASAVTTIAIASAPSADNPLAELQAAMTAPPPSATTRSRPGRQAVNAPLVQPLYANSSATPRIGRPTAQAGFPSINLRWFYRLALIVVIAGIFCPWITTSYSHSGLTVPGGRFGDTTVPPTVVAAQSVSASAYGYQVGWGQLALIAAFFALAVSFLLRFIPFEVISRVVAAAFALALLGVGIMEILDVQSAVRKVTGGHSALLNTSIQMGGMRAAANFGVDFGVWMVVGGSSLALITGSVSAWQRRVKPRLPAG